MISFRAIVLRRFFVPVEGHLGNLLLVGDSLVVGSPVVGDNLLVDDDLVVVHRRSILGLP